MKKVLVVFTPTSFPPHVLKFAIDITKEPAGVLHGIFLDDAPVPFHYPFPNDLATTETNLTNESEEAENEKLVLNDIQTFRNFCQREGVSCEAQRNITLEQLIEYSSSADVIITDARIRLYRYSLADLLTDAHCPVCLVSEAAPEVKHIILTYDGSDSARYAIERFMAVFPTWKAVPAYLVSVNPELEVLEHKEFINQTLPHHFQNLTLKLLQGNVKEVMDKFVKQYPEDAIVVMGAFGRSALSRLFHPSLAKEILKETTATVFIAHQ